MLTNLPRILLTQPWETRSCLLMSHGRTPLCESSTILRRMGSGRGLPLTKTPPSWFTPPCPLDPFPIGSVSAWSCMQKPGCGERARGISFLWFHTVTYECYKFCSRSRPIEVDLFRTAQYTGLTAQASRGVIQLKCFHTQSELNLLPLHNVEVDGAGRR